MNATERRYQRDVDELILDASPEELQKIQELDKRTQLSGDSFYDSFSSGRNVAELASNIVPKKS